MALARSARSGEPLALLIIDLDGFKQVNDGLGHDAGDKLLGEVTERFSMTVRRSDTLARLGGDEFALLAHGSDQAEAERMAERLLEALSGSISIAGRAGPNRGRSTRTKRPLLVNWTRCNSSPPSVTTRQGSPCAGSAASRQTRTAGASSRRETITRGRSP